MRWKIWRQSRDVEERQLFDFGLGFLIALLTFYLSATFGFEE